MSLLMYLKVLTLDNFLNALTKSVLICIMLPFVSAPLYLFHNYDKELILRFRFYKQNSGQELYIVIVYIQ